MFLDYIMIKILKKWEEANHKQWYKLSPKSRKIANEEMEKIKISMDEELKLKKEQDEMK